MSSVIEANAAYEAAMAAVIESDAAYEAAASAAKRAGAAWLAVMKGQTFYDVSTNTTQHEPPKKLRH
jgi:hypothetical protein